MNVLKQPILHGRERTLLLICTSLLFMGPLSQAATFTWEFDEEGVAQKAVVTVGTEGTFRVDRPKDRWSLIYTEATQHFVGLEHRDGTWWEFDWSEVQKHVKNIHGLRHRLTHFSLDGTPEKNVTPAESEATLSHPAILWKGNDGRQKAYGTECQIWTGTVPPDDPVTVLAQPIILEGLDDALRLLELTNEPMILVATRALVPNQMLQVTESLRKAGVTSREITSGLERKETKIRLVEFDSKPAKPEQFIVPKNFRKVPLVALENLLGVPEPTPSGAYGIKD
jgi:hypothetical protein